MIREMIMVGSDTDGVTTISIESIERLVGQKTLIAIEIKDGPFSKCDFIFTNCEYYRATGFTVGYNGEGPQGLYNAVKMFYERPFFDFSVISKMSREKNYRIDFIDETIESI